MTRSDVCPIESSASLYLKHFNVVQGHARAPSASADAQSVSDSRLSC